MAQTWFHGSVCSLCLHNNILLVSDSHGAPQVHCCHQCHLTVVFNVPEYRPWRMCCSCRPLEGHTAADSACQQVTEGRLEGVCQAKTLANLP
jgi:hypothetical protein